MSLSHRPQRQSLLPLLPKLRPHRPSLSNLLQLMRNSRKVSLNPCPIALLSPRVLRSANNCSLPATDSKSRKTKLPFSKHRDRMLALFPVLINHLT